jgi:hypothetical protein
MNNINNFICFMCLEKPGKATVRRYFGCFHIICKNCIYQYIETNKHVCLLCLKNNIMLNNNVLNNTVLNNSVLNNSVLNNI